MKLGLALVAMLAAGTASAASAVTLNVTSVGAYNLSQFRMSGNIAGHGAFNQIEYGGPIVLQGTTGSGAVFSVITYCFDILHPISAGFGSQANLNYTFTSAPILNDQSTGPGTGNSLSLVQIKNISGLARLGAQLYQTGATNLDASMPAIQAAIWSTEYGLAASEFANPLAQSFYDSYMSMTFDRAPTIGFIASGASLQLVSGVQGLALGAGSVPEPGTWVMLILGFGMVGVAQRRRKFATVAA